MVAVDVKQMVGPIEKFKLPGDSSKNNVISKPKG